MSNPSRNDELENLKKTLFKLANESKWEEVIKTYDDNSKAHTAKITSSGDTALHIAISNGEEAVVEKLVAIARRTDGALEIQNELGNTPLHLAAYLGNAKMCSSIARCKSKLMGLRNDDNETPFLLAVRHGRKEAFYALHEICDGGEGYNYCRGKDGETILHSAISGEFFDLAFGIMNLYGKLLNAMTEQGFSPLHILASKPSAFRSGSQIRGLDKLIYHCIVVDELQLNNLDAKPDQDFLYKKETAKYPENYHSCAVAFNLLKKVPDILLGRHKSEKQNEENQQVAESHSNEKHDEEKQPVVGHRSEKRDEKEQHIIVTILRGRGKANAERCQYSETQKKQAKGSNINNAQGHELFPNNYTTFFNIAKLISKAALIILGLGSKSVEKMREKKTKHIWSLQIMEKLLEHAKSYEYDANGKSPTAPAGEDGAAANSYTSLKNNPSLKKMWPEKVEMEMEKKETEILIAARNGVVEIVEGILRLFPVAIHDMNNDNKNVVLLAVEHRQPHVYKSLHDRKIMKETIFRKTDRDGNSALHLAARLDQNHPWLTPAVILQMQWEIKWYEFVKNSMPPRFFPRYNNDKKTATEIFSETHDNLAVKDSKWLIRTSTSCSVVAALVATVAFTASTTIPGGVKSDDTGAPALQNDAAFTIFAISSLVALGFSVTSVVMFLAILTGRYEEKDFRRNLPMKMLVGLTSLLISIACMLLCFCAGHFLVLKDKFEYASLPLYVVTCLPLTFFAILQFPQYVDLVIATISKVPQRFPSSDRMPFVVQP